MSLFLISSMIAVSLSLISPIAKDSAYSQGYSAARASSKLLKEGIKKIVKVKKIKGKYFLLGSEGEIIFQMTGEKDFEIVKQIVSQMKLIPDKLIYLAANARLIKRISPTIQGFIEREAGSLAKVSNLDEAVMTLSSTDPIASATAQRLLSRLKDIHEISGMTLEGIDYTAGADLVKTSSGFWVSIGGKRSYLGVAPKGSDTSKEELKELIKSLSERSKKEGIEGTLILGEGKPNSSITELADKENVKLLYGSKERIKGSLVKSVEEIHGRAGAQLRKPASQILAENLEKAGLKRPSNHAAHHIVAAADPKAEPARRILERFGIDINSAENGLWLKKAVHNRVHTNKYYDEVNRRLAQAKTKEEAIEILRDIGDLLSKNKFPH
jgi:hypothetical protein